MARLPFIHKVVSTLTQDEIEKLTGVAIYAPDQFSVYEHAAEIDLGDRHITVPIVISRREISNTSSLPIGTTIWYGNLILKNPSGVQRFFFQATMDPFEICGTIQTSDAAIPILQQLNS